MGNLFLVALILFCTFDSFYLIPFYHVAGVFNINDVGIALIWIGLIAKLLSAKKGALSKLNNTYTWLIFVYLLFIAMQASFASINYGQNILDGLIRARLQLYYGSFFLFLFIFDTRKNLDRIMALLAVVSIILICLALVNYFGPIIFYHQWAEGHGSERSGIKRALMPGIGVILFAGFWYFIRYLNEKRASIWPFIFFLLSYAAVIFKQTRGRIISLSITIIIVLIAKRKFKVFGTLAFVIILSGIIMNVTMENSILVNPFSSAYEETRQDTGTWGARQKQIELDWEIIKEHPFVGNGGMVLRQGSVTVSQGVAFAGYGGDLGYMHFIKFFGAAGLIWLIIFILVFYVNLKKSRRDPETDKVMADFAGYMFIYMLIAEVTLDFFRDPQGILLLCMTLSILLNSRGALVRDQTR